MRAFLLVEVTDSIQVLAQDEEECRELYNWLVSIKKILAALKTEYESICPFCCLTHQWAFFFIASQQNI